MATKSTARNGYPVEVSGWDALGEFFAVTARMDRHEQDFSTVCLRRRLRTGSLLFLRPLSPEGLGSDCPKPHAVKSIEGPDRMGRSLLQLVQLQPRHPNLRLPDDSLQHLIECVRREVKP